MPATAPAYQRAGQFLLKTQFADGSWFVRTRSIPLQPTMDSGFPYGGNQWISAAGTNWATMALVRAERAVVNNARSSSRSYFGGACALAVDGGTCPVARR